MANTDRFVNIGEKQYVDFYTIKAVVPAECGDDDFSKMMNGAGLFPVTLVILEDETVLRSTEEVETIMARLNQASDPEFVAKLKENWRDAAADALETAGNRLEESPPPGGDPETVAVIVQWLRDCSYSVAQTTYSAVKENLT